MTTASVVLGLALQTGLHASAIPQSPKIIRVGAEEQAAKLIYHPAPEHSPAAKFAAIQGTVDLAAIVKTDGTLRDIRVLRGHPLLVKAALEAVQHWRYQPTLVGGEPVEVMTEIHVSSPAAGQSEKEPVGKLREWLEKHPDDPAAHYRLGIALHEEGDYKAAVGEFLKALSLRPDFSDARRAIDRSLFASFDQDTNVVAYRELVRLNPADAKARYFLGVWLLRRGDLDEALGELRKSVELDPSQAVFWNYLGKALLQRGDSDGAIGALRKAVRLDPKLAYAHYNLGLALEKRGDLKEARKSYVDAQKLDPSQPEFGAAAERVSQLLMH